MEANKTYVKDYIKYISLNKRYIVIFCGVNFTVKRV